MQPISEVVLKTTASHTYLDDILLSLHESLSSFTLVTLDEAVSQLAVLVSAIPDTAARDSTTTIVISSLPHSSTPSNQLPSIRRSIRSRKTPAWMGDFVTQALLISSINNVLDHSSFVFTAVSSVHLSQSHEALMASIENTNDPSTFSESIQDTKWCKAMDTELRALEENKTWEITLVPLGKRAIGCKWIYRTKFHSDGSIDKCKARLVTLGCRQKFGVDYWETFAPVAKMTTVRTLLAVAAIQQWPLYQMNVSNVFLHGDLDEELYMALPSGYAGSGKPVQPVIRSVPPTQGKYVCKLLKFLYGLKQAPR